MRGLFMSDEELGKKDDDHNKPVKNAGQRQSSSWKPTRVPPRRLLKRIVVVLVGAALVYLFIHNIPVLGPNENMRRPTYPSYHQQPNHPQPLGHDMPPPKPATQGGLNALAANTAERNFHGPLNFNNLAVSLQASSNLGGGRSSNKNVLFAAASLKSAATLLPVACQMATSLKNYVHFTLLGRSTISIEQLCEINGIDKSCVILYHDARPDYAAISTDERLEDSVLRGLRHVNTYLHPQAIILDGSGDEEVYFTRGMKQHVKAFKATVIELPRKAAESLSWITKLDSASLQMWNKIKIDISIQATPGSFGGLTRLLRSLSTADYSSSAIPHITIELPHRVDLSTKKFLDSFAWPPLRINNPTNERHLSLRNRLSPRKPTEEETSTRFLESFWPAQPQQSHVLVLSPNVEVSPQFFNYLKYVLLNYYYSAEASTYKWAEHLFGISLEQPLITLDGKRSLSPPLFKHPEDINNEIGGTSNPYLWQAPTSNAVLFFGDKWMELHDFVSRTMQATDNLGDLPAIISEKAVSKQHPSWLEHALRLARVRGYSFLYPGNEVAEHLVTIHGELYEVPEEYTGGKSLELSIPDDASSGENNDIRKKVREAAETQMSPLRLLESLPNHGNLWPLSALPVASWEGIEMDARDFRSRAVEFELAFKEKVGGCDLKSGRGQKPREPMSAQDLFCNVP